MIKIWQYKSFRMCVLFETELYLMLLKLIIYLTGCLKITIKLYEEVLVVGTKEVLPDHDICHLPQGTCIHITFQLL